MITTSIALRTALVCLACGRQPAYVQDNRLRTANPEHDAAVRRLRCPSCIGGRLVSGEVETVYERRPLPTDQCGCGNTVAAGETRYCATCVKRQQTLARTQACRERERMGVSV